MRAAKVILSCWWVRDARYHVGIERSPQISTPAAVCACSPDRRGRRPPVRPRRAGDRGYVAFVARSKMAVLRTGHHAKSTRPAPRRPGRIGGLHAVSSALRSFFRTGELERASHDDPRESREGGDRRDGRRGRHAFILQCHLRHRGSNGQHRIPRAHALAPSVRDPYGDQENVTSRRGLRWRGIDWERPDETDERVMRAVSKQKAGDLAGAIAGVRPGARAEAYGDGAEQQGGAPSWKRGTPTGLLFGFARGRGTRARERHGALLSGRSAGAHGRFRRRPWRR